jgi:hypothetical protein
VGHFPDPASWASLEQEKFFGKQPNGRSAGEVLKVLRDADGPPVLRIAD